MEMNSRFFVLRINQTHGVARAFIQVRTKKRKKKKTKTKRTTYLIEVIYSKLKLLLYKKLIAVALQLHQIGANMEYCIQYLNMNNMSRHRIEELCIRLSIFLFHTC